MQGSFPKRKKKESPVSEFLKWNWSQVPTKTALGVPKPGLDVVVKMWRPKGWESTATATLEYDTLDICILIHEMGVV